MQPIHPDSSLTNVLAFAFPFPRVHRANPVGVCARLWILHLGLLGLSSTALAEGENLLLNGQFTQGLDHWATHGAVLSISDQALLTDAAATRTLLFQGVEVGAGAFTFSFDFQNLLSTAEPSGRAKDTFFASLYFAPEAAAFDPVGFTGFAGFLDLLDLDAAGPRVLRGEVVASPVLAGFSRYTVEFVLPEAATVFAVFDLVDLNALPDDSRVLLDYVVLIPEPALVGGWVGLIALVCLGWRHIKS